MKYKDFCLIVILTSIFFYQCTSMQDAYKEVKNRDTISAYRKFIEEYPNTILADSSKVRIEFLNFKIAEKKHTVDSYKNFSDNYPNSKYGDIIYKKIDSLYFQKAIISKNIDLLEKYVRDNPDGQYVNAAISEIYSRLIKQQGDRGNEIFNNYLNQYPIGIVANLAIAWLEEYYYKSGRKFYFLEHYPISKYYDEVFRKLYEKLIRNGNLISCNQFLRTFPQSEYCHNIEIKKKIELALEKMESALNNVGNLRNKFGNLRSSNNRSTYHYFSFDLFENMLSFSKTELNSRPDKDGKWKGVSYDYRFNLFDINPNGIKISKSQYLNFLEFNVDIYSKGMKHSFKVRNKGTYNTNEFLTSRIKLSFPDIALAEEFVLGLKNLIKIVPMWNELKIER